MQESQVINKKYVIRSKSVKQYAYDQDQNYPIRLQMEDSHFAHDNIMGEEHTGLFSVLDGHGGQAVVNFCVQEVPKIFKKHYTGSDEQNMRELFATVFKETDEEMVKQQIDKFEDSGTCICVALIKQKKTTEPTNNKVCVIANLGDTRGILNEDGVARRISFDHKGLVPSEQERVKKEGGVIFNNRVGGSLAVTRALGDISLKSEGCSVEPHVEQFIITPKTKYLIMATDGLWDVVEDDEAIQLTKDLKNTQLMSQKLLQTAKEKGSRDNIAIMVIQFQ